MATNSQGPVVVRVSNVHKSFLVRKDNTLKDRVLGFVRRKGRVQHSSYTAANGISLDIHAGTTVGLLGANGSGKSTLLKLIGGILSPDSGDVAIRGRIAALLELGTGFHPDLSGRENVYLNAALLGLTRAETDKQFDDIVDFSGIREFIDNEVKFYSSGMYMRLAFAVAVHTDPDILLVDEVLAVGDEAFQRKCMDKIRSFQQEGRTIILVSHAASQISELCDSTFVLDAGEVAFEGDTQGGLAALRGLLEGRRRSGEPGTDTDTEHIDSLAVVSAEVLDDEGSAAETIEQGRPMTLRLHLHATRAVASWTTGFGIDTPNGQMVVGTSTDRLGVTTTPRDAGESWHVDFDFDTVHLGAGDYFVNARADDLAEGSSSVLWQAALVHISGHERAVGIVEASVTASQG